MVPDRLGSAHAVGTVADSRNHRAAAMAGPSTVHRAWRTAGCVGVVRGASALWKCGRLHSIGSVLLFAGHNSIQCAVVCGTADWRWLGHVWKRIHCYCRGTHAVRAARGGAVELAADSAAWPVVRVVSGITIFAGHSGAGGARLDALCRAQQAGGCHRDLDYSMRHRFGDFVCCLLFSSQRFSRRHTSGCVFSDFLASIWNAASVQRARREYSGRQSGVAVRFARGVDHLCGMAAHPLLR